MGKTLAYNDIWPLWLG